VGEEAVSVVSTIVPCRNEARHIAELLDAIAAQTRRPDEVIIVDSSKDETRAVVGQWGSLHADLPVTVVTPRSPAIPVAVNDGVRLARGDIIIRLDAHSSPAREYMALAVDALEADASVGVVGGVWRIAAGAKTRMAEGIARAAAHPAGAGDAAYRIAYGSSGARDVDTVPFGCYRKSLWEELGGLNEALMANEDYEFNYRVRRTGRRVVLDPRITSIYYARATLGALAQQYFRYGWWKAQMLRSHPESLRWRQALPAAFVAGLVGLVLASLVLLGARVLLVLSLAGYAVALAAATTHLCAAQGVWRIWPAVPPAFATMHLSWGSGALVNLVQGGRVAKTLPE
jgi:succinoglycan biosynthesis protein ExoA